jgi:hypothetical protein
MCSLGVEPVSAPCSTAGPKLSPLLLPLHLPTHPHPPHPPAGRIHWRNTQEQLKLVGPKSLGVALLTAGFVGMVFTIQFVREFAKLGLTRSVGGVLGLALARELTPVVTAIILAGRVGSAFAAELGTMQVGGWLGAAAGTGDVCGLQGSASLSDAGARSGKQCQVMPDA